MWVFTVHGMVSVVCGRHQSGQQKGQVDPETVMLRARAAKHLEALTKANPDLLAQYAIRKSTGTDYPCRLVVPRTTWLELASRLAAEISYVNFKSAVAQTNSDPEYGALLHQVWQAGVDYQDRVENPEA
jgi:hypothetical protein